MKKNTIKAFTLVEMLIVIVIIGILIASLMPRMQTAQGRARDVARKNDLSQIQTAIITSQSDRGAWPGMPKNHGKIAGQTAEKTTDTDNANGGIPIQYIGQNLLDAGMSSIPTDPNLSNISFGLGGSTEAADKGQYYYLVGKRNGVNNAGFALMAKTEVEGSSNWVVCQDDANKALTSTARTLAKGYIASTEDLSKVQLCKTVSEGTDCVSNQEACTYTKVGELRYLLLY